MTKHTNQRNIIIIFVLILLSKMETNVRKRTLEKDWRISVNDKL